MSKFFWSICLIVAILSCSGNDDSEVKLEKAPSVHLATDITTNSFTANWENLGGATYYKLQVSKNLNFTQLVGDYVPKQVAINMESVSGVNDVDPYYYRVKAGNGKGETEYSHIMAVRNINKDLLYDILWKGDEDRSNVDFVFQDLLFKSDGTYESYFANNLISTGTWEWNSDGSNVLHVEILHSGSFDITFVEIGVDYYVAYFSELTDNLAYFND